MGMGKTRISDIGRRLVTCKEEDKNPFSSKPGYTWGNSTRSTPKAWDIVQVKLWPRCSYVPLPRNQPMRTIS